MTDLALMVFLTVLTGLIMIGLRTLWRFGPRRGPRRPPAEEIARVFRAEVARVERLSRCGTQLALLPDGTAPDPALTLLGPLSVTAPDRDSALRTLCSVARRRFPDVQALGGITALPNGTRWCADAYALTPRPADNCAIVDGSNVAHWNADHAGGPASLDPVVAVVAHLRAEGARPVVIFDANIGYRIGRRYLGGRALQRRMPAGTKVIVMPRGQPADPAIIARAVKSAGVIVSNDQFRDAATPRMILKRKGCYVHGALHLTDAHP